MDPLSDVLKKVKLSSAVYFKSNFSSPWGMNVAKGPFAQFHIVTRGQCVIKTQEKELQLFAGDIIVFPLGTSHWLADSTFSDLKEGKDVLQSILDGKSIFEGDIVSTTLLCGHFEFDRSIGHPLINELPEIILIKEAERKELSWLENIANLVIQETGSENAGSNIIVNKLSEVLFIHILRAFIGQQKIKHGFLAAIQDVRISAVLSAIHATPEKDWQLASLAQIAGMSRTSFSNQFKNLVNETPLSYITNWRILKAKELLAESKHTVGEIADKVGYQSEAAFNRVFKKRVMSTPLKFRQSVMQ
jgi:AraC-like DNA-binding protein